ncbi:MAG: hypothetical protein KDE03_03725 [Rhodobacteraceae bacterium]|nr:hypothetical protein [Paracoccaceae bacterium]
MITAFMRPMSAGYRVFFLLAGLSAVATFWPVFRGARATSHMEGTA